MKMVKDGTYEAHANRKLNETIHFSESFTVVEPRNYMKKAYNCPPHSMTTILNRTDTL